MRYFAGELRVVLKRPDGTPFHSIESVTAPMVLGRLSSPL
jgi:hypothetical protein